MLGGSFTTTTTSTSPAIDAPASPIRPGRLRRLSYLLRNPDAPLIRSVTSPARPGTAEAITLSTSAPETSIARIVRNSPHPPIDIPNGSKTRNRADTYSAQIADRSASTSHPGVSRSMSEDVSDSKKQAQNAQSMPTIRLIPHHEARASRPSLTFPIINRTLHKRDAVIKVGRYSERDNQGAQQDNETSSLIPVGFKSKVVSRRHCEFWCQNNQWYIKDVKSSSGTFLNHVRLSSAGSESKPYPLNDGDIVQLGIDFKGGEEVIFRCVKIRVECNRSWQKGLNQFNTTAHKRLRDLASASSSKDPETASLKSDECSICLNPVAPYQALFVAPCSHVWHYKCIRTLIYPDWPSFQCPNCRAYADLEADVDAQEPEPNMDGVDGHSETELSEAIRRSNLEQSATTHTFAAGSNPSGASANGDDGDDGEDRDGQAHSDRRAGSTATSSSSANGPLTPPKNSRGDGRGGASLLLRSAMPTSTAPFALVARVIDGSSSSSSSFGGGAENDVDAVRPANEGPTTPRNDAGPFLLDGIAGGAAPGSGAGSGSKRSVSSRRGGGEGGSRE